MNITKIVVRGMPSEQRRQVLDEWFNDHLHCTDGNGHSWSTHRWVSHLKAWLWGPCQKCGIYRLTQPKGNYIEWHPATRFGDALLFDNEFEKIESDVTKFLEAL